MSGPNAFSMRKAISGVSVALPVEKVRERGTAHFQNLRRLRHANECLRVENQTPVSRDGQAPESLQATFERVQS